MEDLSKKDAFKLLIKEFHSRPLPRTIERCLKIPAASGKIVTVYGPRRTGKSCYLFSTIKELVNGGIPKERIIYVNFEDDRLLPLGSKELNLLIEAYFELYPENKNNRVFIFFDEIQNIPGWEVFVRRIYDKENFRIFITGSSSKLLSMEIATALRGRTISYPLYPLNFREFLKFKSIEVKKDFEYTNERFKIKKLLNEYLEDGGFPEIVLEPEISVRRKIFGEYFDLLVYRDLLDRFSLENSLFLRELLKFLFTNTGALLSVNSYYNSVKQALRISRETIMNYLGCVSETRYFFFLPVFSYSLKAQQVNPKKIICLDNGLRNSVSLRFSPDTGKLAENLVGINLLMRGGDLFYWKGKKEVDFVLKENSGITAINVSFSNVIDKRETDALMEFKSCFKNVSDLVLITKDIQKKENGIRFIPLWMWLLQP